MAIRCAALAQLWPSPVLGTACPAPSCSGVSSDTETGTCRLSGSVSLLPAFLSTYQSFPASFTVLCGCSFTLTSACLWTKLLMAFSGLIHERGWQSKWAQGLSASSSQHCLHLEPDTKATVVGTFPFVSVHFQSGKLDIVEGKKKKKKWMEMFEKDIHIPWKHLIWQCRAVPQKDDSASLHLSENEIMGVRRCRKTSVWDAEGCLAQTD